MNNLFTTWLLWLFGLEPPPAGEGTAWQLEGAWTWTPPLVLLAGLAAAGCAALITTLYLRERSTAGRRLRLALAAVRVALVAIVLFVMLFGLRVIFHRTSLPYLAIVVDESASMEYLDAFQPELLSQLQSRVAADGFDAPTRINLAKSLLLDDRGRGLDELAERYKVQVYFVAGAARKQSPEVAEAVEQIRELEPVGKSSRLGAGVREVLDDLRGTQPAAIVLLSDGINTDGPALAEAAQVARRRGVPLVVIGTGSETPARYLALSNLLVDRVVFVDDYVDFEFSIEAAGLEGQTVDVVLRQTGHSGELDRRQVTLGPDGQVQPLRLEHRPTQEGEFEYVIEIENPPQELPERPRRLAQTIRVEKARLRVLLAQGYPNYEYRYLKHMLERDPTIELRTVLQEADLEYAEEDQYALRVFPVSEQELAEYDVLILGDLNPAYLSRSIMENIDEFVTERGRSIIWMSGPRFNPSQYGDTPLAALLPIESSALAAPPPGLSTRGFHVVPSEASRSMPFMQLGDDRESSAAIWRDLPELYWFYEADELKPGVRVLAEHPTQTGSDGQKLPLIALQFVPPGKVLWHATDETYRWREEVGDVYFARYWIQAIRYLARSKFLGENINVELTADRDTYDRGDPVRLRARFFDDRLAPRADDGVVVMLEGEDGRKSRLTLARDPAGGAIFEAEARDLASGKYRAWIASPSLESPSSTEFTIRPPAGELDTKNMDVAALKQAAELSRGRYYPIVALETLPADLPQGRAVKVESLPAVELWNNWRVLALFLGLLVTEWVLRKRAGMM